MGVSSPSQCRLLIRDERSPGRREYSKSSILGWLSRVGVARKKTRRAGDMPQTHLCRFGKKVARITLSYFFSIGCTVYCSSHTLAAAVLFFLYSGSPKRSAVEPTLAVI